MAKREVNVPTGFLVRHGKTKFNMSTGQSRLKGIKFDLPLTDEGRGEAKDAGKFLSEYPIGEIQHSPMQRAAQTAEEISKATDVDSKEAAPLDPWDVGYLSGQKRVDAKRRIEYYIRNPHKEIPEGEPYEDWFGRYSAFLEKWLAGLAGKEESIPVIVTHSCNLMAARTIIKGEEPQFYDENLEPVGGIMRVQKKGGRFILENVDGEK